MHEPSSHVSVGRLGEPLPSVSPIFSQKNCSGGPVLRNVTATARPCVTSSGSVDPNESDQIPDRQRDTRSIRHDHRRSDPEWKPLINTPNFPESPSGHATASGAASHALRLFFGADELNFQITTTNPNAVQKTRSFTRFPQAEDEVVNARVYGGIHYRGTDR